MNTTKAAAPTYASLPPAKARGVRSGPLLKTTSVRIAVVTPILGGAAVTRQLDDIDFIRAATIRGHLRFWWRALSGHKYETAAKLYEGESKLWGRAADDQGGDPISTYASRLKNVVRSIQVTSCFPARKQHPGRTLYGRLAQRPPVR
jgi:hypothetical protein